MQIQKGKNRIVLVFPLLRVVVKFPIIHLAMAYRSVKHIKRIPVGKKLNYLKRNCLYSVEIPNGFRGLLFGGLYSNLNEFWLYWRTHNPFLLPTYFSFFGLFNLQSYKQTCQLSAIDLWCQLSQIVGNNIWDDGHHFSNPTNFSLEAGKLQMFDYGSRRTHRVIKEFGAKIYESFDPTYSWEEEKGKREKKQEPTL